MKIIKLALPNVENAIITEFAFLEPQQANSLTAEK
jgi:hypothetical protein